MIFSVQMEGALPGYMGQPNSPTGLLCWVEDSSDWENHPRHEVAVHVKEPARAPEPPIATQQ